MRIIGELLWRKRNEALMGCLFITPLSLWLFSHNSILFLTVDLVLNEVLPAVAMVTKPFGHLGLYGHTRSRSIGWLDDELLFSIISCWRRRKIWNSPKNHLWPHPSHWHIGLSQVSFQFFQETRKRHKKKRKQSCAESCKMFNDAKPELATHEPTSSVSL